MTRHVRHPSAARIVLATLLLAPTIAIGASASAQKPNIVVILADDLGYGDVQCYNPERGKIPTPHIDRLAAQGMRFTDGHSSSGVCSPSRYALLTGRYHWRTRLQTGIVGVFGEPLIAPARLTIASLTKQHGYRTAAIGKWHLGWDWPIPPQNDALFRNVPKNAGPATDAHRAAWREVFAQTIPGGPTTRGFDTYFGTDVPNWPPYCFIEDNRTLGVPSTFLPAPLLQNHQASLQGPALDQWTLEPILPALRDRAVRFITESAQRAEPFLLYLPLTTPHTPLAVNAEWRGRSGLIPFADLVMETDAAIGRVLAAIEQSGVADRTLVLFTSDNGCAAYIGVPEMERQGHFPSGPLRGYKTSMYEGGHRVPFIVRWPGVVKPGSTCGQLVHHADLIATLAEVVGTKLPADAGEDSFSLLPLLRGSTAPIRKNAVSCAVNGVPGYRSGDWKLVLAPDPKAGTDVELYDLKTDLGEARNVAAAHPAQVAAMRAEFEALITLGRSTPGAPRPNDVEVRRFPQKDAGPKKRGR